MGFEFLISTAVLHGSQKKEEEVFHFVPCPLRSMARKKFIAERDWKYFRNTLKARVHFDLKLYFTGAISAKSLAYGVASELFQPFKG